MSLTPLTRATRSPFPSVANTAQGGELKSVPNPTASAPVPLPIVASNSTEFPRPKKALVPALAPLRVSTPLLTTAVPPGALTVLVQPDGNDGPTNATSKVGFKI